MALQDIVFPAVVAIMFAIVIAAIVNTSLMTVMERTREIGTLMALGYRRRHILLSFSPESAVIGGLGGGLGLAVGGAGSFFGGVARPSRCPDKWCRRSVSSGDTAQFLGLVLVLAVVAALFRGWSPAYRASRMKPVDALSST